MKVQRILTAVILLLFILTLLPLCTYLKYDTGEVQYVNYYRSIGAIAVAEIPISGLLTLLALIFALVRSPQRMLISGILILIAGVLPLISLLLLFRRVAKYLLPTFWVIVAGQIIVGVISIVLYNNLRKRRNQDGKPVQ